MFMDHNIVLSYNYGGGEWMHLHRRPFRWPWRCAGAIWSASPDAAWPGLHRKSLDATIGWLLAPYRLGSRQSDNQHNNDATCTHFAGCFDGHRHAAELYCTHRPVAYIKATKLQHRALTCSDITQSDRPTPVTGTWCSGLQHTAGWRQVDLPSTTTATRT